MFSVSPADTHLHSAIRTMTHSDSNCTGFVAMHAALASRDVDCCLIPESPFYLEGPGGLFEYIEKRLKENGHMVIVVAEGAGQEILSECERTIQQQDASGNNLLQDVGLWLAQKIKVWTNFVTNHFALLSNINANFLFPISQRRTTFRRRKRWQQISNT